ncbi:YfhO family protein [Miniphocaeibacter massiliensis]|uniref:YfhO family protein n=1 Tax=Miniphocaeibacter massiliensis TaxID=2041841 RepID=UPI000C1C6C3B|nr:YfhO family protein [Miniphocaeibacter massiliensis]
MFLKIINKIRNNKNYFHILAFAIPFIILNILYIVFKYYPFGDNQILVVDAYHQYYQFLAELRGKILEGESIFYSWHMGMGTDFLSLMAYYCASPLNLLSILVPAKLLSYFFAVLISLKISFASLFCLMYLKSIYNKKDYTVVIFSLLYAFCGFLAGYYWNIMWLDVVSLLPLVALGLKQAITKNKYGLYLGSLALCLLTNYYMSIFICIFIVIFYFFYSINIKVKFTNFIKKGFAVLGSSLLSAGLCAWILIPTFIGLGKVYKTASPFQGEMEIYESFLDVLSNMLAFNYPTVTEGLPNIYSGLICLFLLVVYYYSKEIKLREKILSFMVLVFLILSTNINILNYIWHGLRYTNMLPYRFTFIFSFVVIVLSYKGYKNLNKLASKEFIALGIMSLGIVVLLAGNRELPILIANIILFSVYLVLLYLKNYKTKKVYGIILFILIIAEITANAFIGLSTAGKTTYSQFHQNRSEIEALVKKADKKEKGKFYRMEVVDRFTFNDPPLYQYNGVSFFSSTIDARISKFLDDIGIPSYPLSNRYFYNYGSPVTNSIFDIKYLVSKNKKLNDNFTMDLVDKENNTFLYRNHKALPLGFMVDKNSPNVNYAGGLINNQNTLFKSFTGIKDNVFNIISKSNVTFENIELFNSLNDTYDYKMDEGQEKGKIEIEYNIPKTGFYYLESDKNLVWKVKIGKEDALNEYETRENTVIPSGYYQKGDKVKVSVDLIDEDDGNYYCKLALLNEEVFQQGYEKLSSEIINIDEYSSSNIKGNITVLNDGYFFTSIPYNEGWELYVDGKKKKIVPYKEAFVGAYLDEGNQKIEFKYKSPGFVEGMIITEISIIIITGLYSINKLKKLKKMKYKTR